MRVVLANSQASCATALLTDNVFNGRAHSMMHRIFTVVLVVAEAPRILDVQRRYLMRSQSEAMFVVLDLEFPDSRSTVALRTTVSGAGPARAKQAAKAKARSTRLTRRRLGDEMMDPGVVIVDAGAPEQEEGEEEEDDQRDGVAERRAGDARMDAPVVGGAQLRRNVFASLAVDGQHAHRWESLSFVMRRRMHRGSTCTTCLEALQRCPAWICLEDECVDVILCQACHQAASRPARSIRPASASGTAAVMAVVRFVSAEPAICGDADD